MPTEKTYRVSFDLTEEGIEVLHRALVRERSACHDLGGRESALEWVSEMMTVLLYGENGGK